MTFDLRTWRMNEGVTLTALASETGVSRHTLMRLERGGRPQAPTARAIADRVGRPAAELWPVKDAA